MQSSGLGTGQDFLLGLNFLQKSSPGYLMWGSPLIGLTGSGGSCGWERHGTIRNPEKGLWFLCLSTVMTVTMPKVNRSKDDDNLPALVSGFTQSEHRYHKFEILVTI